MTMELFMLLLVCISSANSLFNKKRSEEATFTGEIFCRNKSHLIRLEKIGEIFLVEASVESRMLLQCKFCDEEDSRKPRLWYRQNYTTGEIREIEFNLSGKRPRIKETELHSFVNYNVSIADIGFYYCKFPYEDSFNSGFNYLVEILDKNFEQLNGTILQWKNYSDEYLVPVNNELQKQFMVSGTDVKVRFEVFSSWSDWTFCEICTKTPHQFQTAHCRVRAVCLHEICSQSLANGTTKGEAGVVRLLLNTSTSLPCRGQLLQHFVPQIAVLVKHIPDFRRNQSCQLSCPLSGGPTDSIEKKLLNFEEGQSAIIPCSRQLGNSNVKWEYNKRKIDPKEWNTPDRHVLIDHFGTLHLSDVTRDIKGTYKCFSGDIPIEEIKIRVHRKSKLFGKGFLRHFRYLLSVILVCFSIFFLMVIVPFCRTKFSRSRKMRWDIERNVEEGLKPLLSEDREEGLSESSDAEKYVGLIEEEEEQKNLNLGLYETFEEESHEEEDLTKNEDSY